MTDHAAPIIAKLTDVLATSHVVRPWQLSQRIARR